MDGDGAVTGNTVKITSTLQNNALYLLRGVITTP